jgi:broad specificity polyphosphatase/5'/3'-nucleotidase SurE
MPITPQELRNKIEATNEAAVKVINQVIENTLNTQWDGEAASVVNVAIPDTTPRTVIMTVCNVWRSRGWKVTPHSEQRGGQWLAFQDNTQPQRG